MVASLKRPTFNVFFILASDQSPAQHVSRTFLMTEYESWTRPLNIEDTTSRRCSKNVDLIALEVTGSKKDRTNKMYRVRISSMFRLIGFYTRFG